MVGLSELSVHDSVEYGVNAAIEPSEVGTEHVQPLWCKVIFVSYVKQQEGDKAEHKTEKHSEAHSCHTLKFIVVS